MSTFDHAIEKLEFEKVRQRVIRYASSDVGKELLRAVRPSSSLEVIRLALSRVTEMKRLFEEEEGLPLEGIHSVREALQKSAIEGSILQPKELAHIHSTLATARVVRQFLVKRSEQYPKLWDIAAVLHADKVLEYNLEHAIDETGAVRASASRELQSIRRAIADKYDSLKSKLASILKSVSEQGFSQDDIITTREGRMVIPVKSEHKNRVHGFIHSASASGATVFVEPSETLDLNNDIRSLQFQEQREIERILKDLTEQVGNIREQLLVNLRVLAELDAITAKAKYSIEVIGIEPQFNDRDGVRLLQARHPILLQAHGRDGTVPLDLDLGNTFKTLIISGPNAGGKSVAMKTVGLLSLMAQSGLHIPASDESVLRVFGDVFVDIGDEQSIENDLSTFSSHLSNLKEISERADQNSLVLIDEIGSGTDPAEGGAIAAAFLDSLTQRGAYTIATTHHSALKVFAHSTEGVENGAMEFDQSNLTPTYRFRAGIPGSSYALEMAQRLGFESVMLQRSREFMGEQQVKLERLIAELESSAQEYRMQLEALQSDKQRLDELVKQYKSKLAVQAAEQKELKRKAVEEAAGIVENANAVIERSIREIREQSAKKETIRRVRDEVETLRQDIATKESQLPPEPKPDRQTLEIGDAATLAGGTEVGEISSFSPDRKTAIVLFGSLKMKVATKDLVKTKSKRREQPSSPTVEPAPQDVMRDIDLRGMTSEEAIPLVDKFIDTAMLAGLHRIDIIHGKGTGALRKKITEYLAHHPRVKTYRLGEWNEGGTGATVVELAEH